jgi:hypothetical protein
MVLGLYMGTKGVEGFVMLFFFEMREFVGDNHPQKGFGYFFERMGDTNLIF